MNAVAPGAFCISMRVAAMLLILLGVLPGTQAQTWPGRPVRVVVPFPAGGPADVLGRVMSARFTEALGQQFVVDNRAGANGNIGANLVAKASNDGYTIMFATTGPLALNRLMYKTTPYDPTRDFAPIILFGDVPLIIVANQTTPLKNLKELIAQARSNPEKFTFASPGHGSMAHLVAELIQRNTGAKLTHVPYKGSAPAMTEFLGGSFNIAFDLASTYLQHVKAGTVRALAVTTATRFAALPYVPTVSEAGIPGYQAAGWFGIVGPAGMPQEAIMRLNALSNAWLASPEGVNRLRDLGSRPIGGTPEELAAFVRSEYVKWRPVVEPIAAALE